MHDDHLVNVMGAMGLAVADLIDETVTDTASTSRSGAAALAVLAQADELSVTELGRRVWLSQPAAARMVDTLQQAGHVTRVPGPGRQVLVHLTEAGTVAARRILANRSAQLDSLLDGLTQADQATLAGLIDKILTNVYAAVPDVGHICRLCDRGQCVKTTPRCPVGLAAGEDPAS